VRKNLTDLKKSNGTLYSERSFLAAIAAITKRDTEIKFCKKQTELVSFEVCKMTLITILALFQHGFGLISVFVSLQEGYQFKNNNKYTKTKNTKL
jgi:hypothetical protein